MRLRPHHLLCTQGFSGKGYSPEFVENMRAIVNTLRSNPDTVIEVVFSTDDICECCPKMLGENLCEVNDKVNRLDQKVIGHFGIEEKEYTYREALSKIATTITPEIFDDICEVCGWHPFGVCKRKILCRR
ncbi:MAG: DUF1284 domain-containing protein [Oscillospiraceae bacterium]|nr:DUF1284 domain-containing protein [Oscillospiraceae bacterium]